MLTLLSLSAITKDSTNHSLILPTLCLIFHVCLAYSIDSATTLRMILPVSENVFCFGKERNSKTIKIVNYVFGEIWTIGIMNLILKDKTDSVMPESFVVSQKCAALIVRGFFFTFFTHANAKKNTQVFLCSTYFTAFFACAARYRVGASKRKMINTAATIYFVTLSAYVDILNRISSNTTNIV